MITDPNGLQRNEKQRVNCKATVGYRIFSLDTLQAHLEGITQGGSFTITFRGYTTAPILTTDSVSNVRQKLTSLPSVNAATVTFGGVTVVACTPIGNDISIEFTQDFGKCVCVSSLFGRFVSC